MNGKMFGKQKRISEEEEKAKLQKFRNLVQDILKPEHDDDYLLRWLRARDYDVYAAEKMITESFKFRKKIGADALLTPAYELPEIFRIYRCIFSLGLDSEGSSVRFWMGGTVDFKGIVRSIKFIDLCKVVMHYLENDLKMMKDNKGNKKNYQGIYVIDAKNVPWKQFFDKSVITYGIGLIKMYQDNYPETLKVVYMVNVPSYFSWIFNLFKPFFNSVTLAKIKICDNDDWLHELKKTVDPKLIPACLGGERTDPDGNPKCHSLICWDSKVDRKFYLSERSWEDDPTLKSTIVPQRGSFEVPVEVENSGSLLRWIFQTKDYNIRFGLFYRTPGSKAKRVEVLPIDNIDCQDFPEENEYVCDKAGTYVLHFDNSYSWMTAKQLFYKVEVELCSVMETNNN